MPNRLVVGPLLLLIQLLSGCATTMNPRSLGPNPDAVTDAIAQAGESDPTPPAAPTKKQPDSPRWSYIMTKMEDVGEAILCIPIAIVGWIFEWKTENNNLKTAKPGDIPG